VGKPAPEKNHSGETNLELTGAGDSGSGISCAICRSLHGTHAYDPLLYHSHVYQDYIPLVASYSGQHLY